MIETRPEADRLQSADPATPEWSESLILMGYDPASEHAFYWHFSRMIDDSDTWEGIVVIYRPDGEVIIDRSLGKHGNNEDAASSGPCSFMVEEPLKRWRARFVGEASRSTTRDAALGLVEEDHSVRLRAEMVFDGSFPTFSAGGAMDNQDWGDGHLEQGGRITGTIEIDDETISLDCQAFRDHTWGRRNYEALDRHAWCFGFFPSGRVFLVLEAWHDPDEYAGFGFVVDGETMLPAKPVRTPPLDDPEGSPRKFTVDLESDLGEMSVEVEMLHAMPFLMGIPLAMPLGTDWSNPRNTINVEGPTVVEWNGERGYGWIERTNRIERLERPND